MDGASTVERLLVEVAKMLQPLATALSSRADLQKLLRSFGYLLADADADGTLSAATGQRDALGNLVDALETLMCTAQDHSLTLEDMQPVLEQVPAALGLVANFADILVPLSARLPSDFPEEVFDLLITSYLAFQHETIHAIAVLLGLIEYRPVTAGSADPDARDCDYLKVSVQWTRLGALFRDPASVAGDLYEWGQDQFASNLLLVRLQTVADTVGVLAVLEDPEQALVAALWPASVPTNSPAVLRIPMWTAEDDEASAVVGVLLT